MAQCSQARIDARLGQPFNNGDGGTLGGFTLVEVVVALGLCVFVLVALLGLFSSGWSMSRESESQIQAANLASGLIAGRVASPTNGPSLNAGIPFDKLAQPYGNAFSASDQYITTGGVVSASPTAASFRVVCNVGTNAITGPKLAQIYLLLTWPPLAAVTNAAGRYEILTYVSLP